MRPRYIGGSAVDARSLDVDLIDSGSGPPRQMREGSCGRTVDDTPVQGEFRPVTGAHEMPFSIIECVRAAQVWTGNREYAQLPVLASHEAAESRIPRRVVLAAVGHDERSAVRRIEARRSSLAQRLQRSGQRDAYLLLHLFRVTRWEQVHRQWRDRGDNGCRHDRAEPPADERAPGGLFR